MTKVYLFNRTFYAFELRPIEKSSQFSNLNIDILTCNRNTSRFIKPLYF
jgi:hypothetical protein